MKRIYLLMIFMIAVAATAFAQRNPNLSISHKWGKTGNTTKIFENGDKILASGGDDAGAGKTGYYLVWNIYNNGTNAIDTIAKTDSIIIRAYAIGTRIILKPSDFGTTFPKNPNGLKQKDTLNTILADNAGNNIAGGIKQITPSGEFPPSKYPDFTESTTYDFDWCDSVYASSTVPGNPVGETDFSNNTICNTVKLTLWNTGVNDVIEGNGIMMFPNPAYNKVSLRYDFGINATANITVVDITGKVVYQQELGSNISGMKTFNLDLVGLPKGMYILKLSTNDKVVTERFDMM